jgi:hypothetical protein
MEAAVAEYEQLRCKSNDTWMLGRFIVPVVRLRELREACSGVLPMPLSVISSIDGFTSVAHEWWNVWGQIEVLEVPLRDRGIESVPIAVEASGLMELIADSIEQLPVFVEGTRDFASLARFGFGAKLRCGGIEPAAFPSVEDVAGFIYEAVAAGVPFKATAGLHHPVRHFNEAAGVMMHGFLNILIAAARADTVGRAGVAQIVAEEDPAALKLTEQALMRLGRERFVSYGSCSFEEPVADLRALGVLPAE